MLERFSVAILRAASNMMHARIHIKSSCWNSSPANKHIASTGLSIAILAISFSP